MIDQQEQLYDHTQGSVAVYADEVLTVLEYFNRFLDGGRFRATSGPPGSNPCGLKQWIRALRYPYHRQGEYRLICKCGFQYDVAIVPDQQE